MLLNPVLQFPYQVEIEELHPTTYEMYKREVVNLLTSKQLPTFSDKFGRFQATTWLMLEQVFEKCADFDSTNKIKASYLVETFDHTLIRRSSLQKQITCWEHFCWATSCRRKCHSYVKRSFGSCNKLLLFHVGADCWTHFGWKRGDCDLPSINAALDRWQFCCENVNSLRHTQYFTRQILLKNRMSCLKISLPRPKYSPRKEEAHHPKPFGTSLNPMQQKFQHILVENIF